MSIDPKNTLKRNHIFVPNVRKLRRGLDMHRLINTGKNLINVKCKPKKKLKDYLKQKVTCLSRILKTFCKFEPTSAYLYGTETLCA